MIGKSTHKILSDRYGDISRVEIPSEFEGIESPIIITMQCFQKGYIQRTLDGFEWSVDFTEYPIFVDMVELLSQEIAQFMEDSKWTR